MKFTTLDMSSVHNAGRKNRPLAPGQPAPWRESIEPGLARLPGGDQTFWGVPFVLGDPEAEIDWVVLGPGIPRVEMPIDATGAVSYLVFAHFCDSSDDPAIGRGWRGAQSFVSRPGEHLADYILCYANGEIHRQPIRRRFEINDLMIEWGQQAFAARLHVQDAPLEWNGPHDAGGWGRDQIAVSQGYRKAQQVYWVYALPNPHPDWPLRAIAVESTGAASLAIAGITLFHGRDHPLQHRRLETLRVSLPEAEQARPITAEVDLGILARIYALPSFAPEEWLRSSMKGWGEPAEPRVSGNLYLDLTASADATLKLQGHTVDLREAYARGQASSADGQARVEWIAPSKVWVNVTVVDGATGLATPARVHFRSPEGRYLPPYGHRHEVNDNWFEDYGADLKLGATEYAYVDGRFSIELPAGACYAEVVKGFEYEPLRVQLDVDPTHPDLALRLERPIDLRRAGWVTADTHVHFLSPETAWLEAQAEGLNLINLLASQWGDLFTNVGDWTGAQSGSSRGDTLVWVGTENRQHFLGHMNLLGGKGRPVYPMCASGASESYLGDPTWSSLSEWADRCRASEGLVVIPHFPNPYAEVVADILLGKIDGVEIRDFHGTNLNTYGVTEWYRFLNLGYRVAAVGGTDKMSAGMPVGGLRTYAHIGDREFTFESWSQAVRAGRTFTSSGPLIGLEVEGQGLGAEVQLPSGGGSLEAKVWARSVLPFHLLQLVVNGQVVAEERREEGTCEMAFSRPLRVDQSCWIAARCLSLHKAWHVWPVHLAAHTSPVYVTVDGQRPFNDSDARFMHTMLEGGLVWLDTLSIPASPAQHARNRRVFQDAREELDRLARTHTHR